MAPLRQTLIHRQGGEAQGQGEADIQPCVLPAPQVCDAVHPVLRQAEEGVGDLGGEGCQQDSPEIALHVMGVEEALGDAEEEDGAASRPMSIR